MYEIELLVKTSFWYMNQTHQNKFIFAKWNTIFATVMFLCQNNECSNIVFPAVYFQLLSMWQKGNTTYYSVFMPSSDSRLKNMSKLAFWYICGVDGPKLYIRVVLCVQGQCYQMKVQMYGHLLPNKFSKIKSIKFWLKNHQ